MDSAWFISVTNWWRICTPITQWSTDPWKGTQAACVRRGGKEGRGIECKKEGEGRGWRRRREVTLERGR